MSFGSDVFDFEKFNLGEMWDKVKKNPERIFIGAIDPASSGMWSKITGKDYEPIVDQWGGASKDTYGKAEADGIDTTAGHNMHQLARAIASFYAGGYGAQSAGLLGGGSTAAAEGASSGGGLLGAEGAGTAEAASGTAGGTAGANTGLLGKMSGYAKQAQPIMQAGSTGMSMANQMNPQQKIQASPMQAVNGSGANTMSNLYQMNQQNYLAQLQQEAAARMQRRNMWG